MKRQCYIGILLVGLALTMACNPKGSPLEPVGVSSHALSTIDSLMWQQPDSAFAQLLKYAETTDTDSLDAFDRHYFQLLVSELFYKNDYAQSNRLELQQAVAYYDSLNSTLADNSRPVFRHCGPDPQSPSLYDLTPFLSARAHYINGVGYYENDSAVEACAEYLKALEVMEDRFEEKELVGKRAQFMALAHTRLVDLFSKLYLHEQAIYFGKLSLDYYQKYDAETLHIAWVLSNIAIHYDILGNYDSAYYYYEKGLEVLPDTNNLSYRDIATGLACSYHEQGGDAEVSLNQLRTIIAKVESEAEYYSRCLTIGEMFYDEKMYDSAWYYFEKVFGFTQSEDSKKLAAERLIEINKILGKEEGTIVFEYADYLVPFANQEEINGAVKSQLIEQYKSFDQWRLQRQHQRMKLKNVKWTVGIITGLLVVFSVLLVIFNRKNNRKKQHLETVIKTERQAHKMQQAALASRLKQSNAALKKHKDETRPTNSPSSSHRQNAFAENYEEEPVCRHILALCNDKTNPIKSTVPVAVYADIALDDIQKSQLRDAALHHYGPLFHKLKREHPEFKEKDFQFCYLSLLGLDNVQIAALLQNSMSTIWEREKRLKRIFGSEDRVSVLLHSISAS